MRTHVVARARTTPRQRDWTALAVCLGLSSSARVASAQQPPPPAPWNPPEAPANRETATRASDGARPERYWYGWQSLIVDGASLAVFIPGALTRHETVWLSAGLVFALGGPIVHWAHGNIGRGFGSLGIRVIAAPLLLLSGLGMGKGDIVSALLATALYAVPAAIDAALLGYDAPASTTPGRLVWAPTLDLRAGGVAVGVAGSF